jgi:hypothetical protein
VKRRSFMERCVAHTTHREHLFVAVLLVGIELCIEFDAMGLLQVLLIFSVFGRDFMALIFDDGPEVEVERFVRQYLSSAMTQAAAAMLPAPEPAPVPVPVVAQRPRPTAL